MEHECLLFYTRSTKTIANDMVLLKQFNVYHIIQNVLQEMLSIL